MGSYIFFENTLACRTLVEFNDELNYHLKEYSESFEHLKQLNVNMMYDKMVEGFNVIIVVDNTYTNFDRLVPQNDENDELRRKVLEDRRLIFIMRNVDSSCSVDKVILDWHQYWCKLFRPDGTHPLDRELLNHINGHGLERTSRLIRLYLKSIKPADFKEIMLSMTNEMAYNRGKKRREDLTSAIETDIRDCSYKFINGIKYGVFFNKADEAGVQLLDDQRCERIMIVKIKPNSKCLQLKIFALEPFEADMDPSWIEYTNSNTIHLLVGLKFMNCLLFKDCFKWS